MLNHPFDRRTAYSLIARPLIAGLALLAIVAIFQPGCIPPAAVTGPLSPGAATVVHKARTRPSGATVDVQSGIEIIPSVQENMFPEEWADPASPTTATSPEPELVPYAIEGIKRALRKYPTSFLKKNLSRVYIVNNLLVDGQPSGGVNAPDMKTIYVDLDNLDSREVAAWSEETIHHEFAHLLADTHPTNISMQTWPSLNRPGFKYGNGGTDAIRIGKDGDEITPEYLSQGFVEQYSKSDPSEDFATLCERMFSGDRAVRIAVARYPLLRRKANRVLTFYHSLDQSFTESYFKKLQPSRMRSHVEPARYW